MNTIFRIALLGTMFIVHPTGVSAQVFPFVHYTSKEGLLSNYTLSLFQDSRGFLWIGSNDGLTSYDGHSFRNYTIADGLSFSRVNC
ncbi:MAG: hypothetical protein HY966_03255, partial [Ignavibacteriales bacterium]|nr:hypothetical protein [Ignavibacteriales bacterium]